MVLRVGCPEEESGSHHQACCSPLTGALRGPVLLQSGSLLTEVAKRHVTAGIPAEPGGQLADGVMGSLSSSW